MSDERSNGQCASVVAAVVERSGGEAKEAVPYREKQEEAGCDKREAEH